MKNFTNIVNNKCEIHAGIDTETVSRIQKLNDDLGEYFLKHIYTNKELEIYRNLKTRTSFLSCIFSMKESISKLLGTGFNGIRWREISIEYHKNKSATINLYENGLERFRDIGGNKIHSSFSFWQDEVITIAISE
ncbi:holo-ACP synthase [Clostridium beijerinckii]|uniref:Holo-[acyl-carrier-protein] synthase n=1 Tax=Clostridium beijerinckii TaxID=1520 RepID=A0A1S8SKK0_CLOBE|nr:4'-phosphopantetheinyl transferase superfamily protein [Clostridium beijerinckii]NRY61553.1 phosphopantetheine--protein transferase-like protein [Clostridium beijerinckii]OOM65852.1 holo-[acyl-carrier-protein] synthase [Clostridium beijerinckii]